MQFFSICGFAGFKLISYTFFRCYQYNPSMIFLFSQKTYAKLEWDESSYYGKYDIDQTRSDMLHTDILYN